MMALITYTSTDVKSSKLHTTTLERDQVMFVQTIPFEWPIYTVMRKWDRVRSVELASVAAHPEESMASAGQT